MLVQIRDIIMETDHIVAIRPCESKYMVQLVGATVLLTKEEYNKLYNELYNNKKIHEL